ncbi:MAG: energy-coupling factor transporter ATPase [Acutalibacteraceae bacterium]|nr:energy-coupling factor transporter ATPase [Acutalibacteraceae bacterium]
MPIISLKNVSHTYSEGTPLSVSAIQNINLDIESGELVGIIGHTGSGKSTLVQHLNGLLKPTSGTVEIDGEDIWANKKNIRSVRFKVGLCFQYPEYQLFEETVYKDISFGPRNMGMSKEEIKLSVLRAAEYVGLKAELLGKSPFDLSGGEKRRAAIAGVMAMNPKILILDEPTAGLDPKGRQEILNMIVDYRRKTGSTVLLVSHSMEDIAGVATKILVMNKSHVAMYDTVENVFSRAEELEKMGLNVPQVTRVFMKLKAKGIDIATDIFTVTEGCNRLVTLMKGGRVL